MDDFIGLAQTTNLELKLHRHLMYNINEVFHPDDLGKHQKELILDKKLDTSDATWTMIKNILGWKINMEEGMLELPSHRVQCLKEILKYFHPKQKTASKW